MNEYRKIHRGQIWRDPANGNTITINEVYASDPYDNGDWRAMVRYTITGEGEHDPVRAQEFGDWIKGFRFVLVDDKQQEVSA